MNTKNLIGLFRAVAILTMANIFLMIVFNNLPFPLSSVVLYTILFSLITLLFYPQLLVTKGMILVYLFVIIYLIGIPLVWNDRQVGWGDPINYRWIVQEMVPVYTSILIFTYFIYVRDFKGLALVVFYTFLFILITSITSIIGLSRFPMAARDSGGTLMEQGMYNLLVYYRKIGIATFGFFTGISLVIPVVIYSLKKFHFGIIKGIFYIGSLTIIVYGILMARYTNAILFTVVLFSISIIHLKNLKRLTLIGLFALILVILVPSSQIAGLFYFASKQFKGTLTEERLFDAGLTIEFKDIDRLHGKEHAARKLGRIPELIDSFIGNPLIGGGENYSHNFWLDRLSLFGLIGFLPWLLIVMYQIRNNLKIFNQDYKPYYILAMFSFIALGFINNMGGSQFFTIVFFLIPGTYFLKYLSKVQSN